MESDSPHQSWQEVRRHDHHFTTILRHQSRKRRDTVLVGQLPDGRWASSNLHLGSTVGTLKLGLSMRKQVKNLYEVSVSPNTMTFSSAFETDKEGGIVEGTISVVWQVIDPVALVSRPRFDHLDAIRDAVEDKLRPLVRRTTLEDVEKLAEVADRALTPMIPLREGCISWGKGDTLFRLNGMGALHRHSLESIRRALIVDREQRAMDQERIKFYGDVIESGKVSLLAMMLSQDKENVERVLNYIQAHDIPVGRAVAAGDDPFRNAVSRLMNEADEFDLNEMRLDWLSSVASRNNDNGLTRLQAALNESISHGSDRDGGKINYEVNPT